MVVKWAEGGEDGELLDGEGAVGVFGSGGERVEEVEAVEFVVGDGG